jgi:hypothetical protein
MEFDEIYAILDDPENGSAEEWAQRYMQHPAYQKYISEPCSQHAPRARKNPQAKQKDRSAERVGRGFRGFASS